jgi:broad specificity phosphatase PhoE
MPSVYFIRHAESEFNKKLELIGGDAEKLLSDLALKDCGLTDVGKEQARRLDEELRDVAFDIVVVSPMCRTQETFQNMPKLYNSSAKVYITPLCREYKTDICDFTFDEEVVFESEMEILNRVASFKDFLYTTIQDSLNVAVITHGDFIYYCCEDDRSKDESIYHLDNARYAMQHWE